MNDIVLVKRPQVAGIPRKRPVAMMAGTLGVLGLAVFLWLSEARAAQQEMESTLPSLASTTTTAPPESAPAPPPPSAPVTPAPNFFVPKSGPVTLVANTMPQQQSGFVTTIAPRTVPADRMAERYRAPTLVVDLAQVDPTRAAGSSGTIRSDSGIAGGIGSGPAPGPAADRNLSETERFSARVGNEEVEVATARRMTGLDRLVPQGAIIGAVMETALNSDLPGFARATVQRDVRSFDGSAVLIPAGSRIVGQYKSGVAQGASRVFVLWTRLIRPDGVSIELASPAVDELGRGGIGGKVNRHFLQRFGGAILTSVLSGGISAAAASLSGGSTVIVGSASQATGLASQATQSADIPPTITTRQGAAVRIFVARDLDFSRVGPAQ